MRSKYFNYVSSILGTYWSSSFSCKFMDELETSSINLQKKNKTKISPKKGFIIMAQF